MLWKETGGFPTALVEKWVGAGARKARGARGVGGRPGLRIFPRAPPMRATPAVPLARDDRDCRRRSRYVQLDQALRAIRGLTVRTTTGRGNGDARKTT
eukprot:14462002-Alexandrium_andersonii.AAC.1